MVSAAELLSANDSLRNLFFLIGSGKMPEYGDKELTGNQPCSNAFQFIYTCRENLLPTFNVFGTLPVVSFPSDSLPAPWDFLALLNILLHLLLPQGQLFSSWSILLPPRRFLGKRPQVVQSVCGSACHWDMLPSAAPLPRSETHWILSDKDFICHSSRNSPPVAVSSRQACAPACESALTHSTYFSRLHRSIRLNETLNYQTSKLRISKQDKWMSCIGAWLCNPSSAEHLLLGTGKTNRLRNKEAT